MSTKAVALEKVPETKETSNLKLVEPATLFERMNRVHDEIARRALKFWQATAQFSCRELDDWFKAGSGCDAVHVGTSPKPPMLSDRTECSRIRCPRISK